MGRHRSDDFVPDGTPTDPIRLETKRRVWPVPLLIAALLAGSASVPVVLSRTESATIGPGSGSPEPRSVPTERGTPEPEPTKTPTAAKPKPTVTKTITKAGPTVIITRSAVVPTTIFRDRMIPGPVKTITRTALPKPRVTITKTITNVVCYGYRPRTGESVGVIECP